jgi:hypothetical protein
VAAALEQAEGVTEGVRTYWEQRRTTMTTASRSHLSWIVAALIAIALLAIVVLVVTSGGGGSGGRGY